MFTDYELSSEYLDERDLNVEENTYIKNTAEAIAKFLCDEGNITLEEVEKCVDIFTRDSSTNDFIYDETIEILKDKYNIEFNDIKI